MNCISGCQKNGDRRRLLPATLLRRLSFVLLAAPVMACGGPSTETASDATPGVYQLLYRVTPDPAKAQVTVEVELMQSQDLLREVRFRAPASRFGDFDGDGGISRDGDTLAWSPPRAGGRLSWQVSVPHRRNGNGYDAWLGEGWGLFRAEDIIPAAATRSLTGASSETRLAFELPAGWSVVTQYPRSDESFLVTHDRRRFKQPKGSIVMGRLGVRREDIAGVNVAIAAPTNNGVRRLDMLALLNWTFPELARIVPRMPSRLTIVSANDPMWRGGLSAPHSLYIHADRPLLSENGTSTLLHEVMHVVLEFDTDHDHDWIVEGLAEYYGLELLRRSGTISRSRFDRARKSQKDWSRSSDRLCGGPSSGAMTAKAVSVFLELDREIRRKTKGAHNLDDVVAGLLQMTGHVDVDALDTLVRGIIGENPDALHIDKLPGCRKMAQD